MDAMGILRIVFWSALLVVALIGIKKGVSPFGGSPKL